MDIVAHQVVVVKQASGEVFFEIYIGGPGQNILVAQFSMPAADVTNVNTNVNGGATDATRTFNYPSKTAGAMKGKMNNVRSNW